MGRRHGLGVILALVTIVGGFGCSPEAGAPLEAGGTSEISRSEAAGRSPNDTPDLIEIPRPALDRLDDVAVERLSVQRAELDRLSTDPAVEPALLARSFGETGRHYQAQELFDAAAACYVNARRLAPEEPRWSYLHGHVLRALGRSDEALEAFTATVERVPNDLPALVALGEIYRQRGQLDSAMETFERALGLDSGNAYVHAKLAETSFDAGVIERAIEHYRRALELQPEASVLHYPLASAYRAQGDLELAEVHLAQRGDRPLRFDDPLIRDLRSLTTGSQQHLNAGGAAFDRGDFSAAAAAFQNAVSIEPTNPKAHLNLASALARLGRLGEAEAEFRQALELDPRLASAHFNLGTLLAAQNRLPEAIEAYRQSLLIDPNDPSARFNLANALRRAGRNAESRRAFEGVLELDPANGSAHLAIIMSLVADSGCRAALDRLTTSRAVLVSDRSLIAAEIRLLAACPDGDVRDGDTALRLGQALVAGGASIGGLESLAMAHAEVGDFERAVATQERALVSARGRAIAEVVQGLETTLAEYRVGRPCRDPWPATALDGIS